MIATAPQHISVLFMAFGVAIISFALTLHPHCCPDPLLPVVSTHKASFRYGAPFLMIAVGCFFSWLLKPGASPLSRAPLIGQVTFGSTTVKAAPGDTIEISQSSLSGLFDSDFGSLLRGQQKRTLTASDGSTVSVRAQLYIDFPAKAEFIGFYIPASRDTVAVCKALASDYRSVFVIGDRVLSGGIAGEQTAQGNLTFTGRAYIYHESRLTLEQIVELRKAFGAENIEPEFRGLDYLMRHLAESKGSAKASK